MTGSRREQAKEQRRERILAATEELIRDRGDTDFSMRELAAGAGVAFATPFNLFGSKEGLLAALLLRRMWPRQEALAAAPPHTDAIDHVLTFTVAAFATYADDAELFRPLLRAVLVPSDGPSFDSVTDLWSRSLHPAREEGVFGEGADDRRVERALHIAFRGALLGWVRGDVSAAQAERDLVFTVGMLLAGAVVDPFRDRVVARLSQRTPHTH